MTTQEKELQEIAIKQATIKKQLKENANNYKKVLK